MLTKYFIEFAIFLISQVLSLLSSVLPGWDYLSTLTDAINQLLGVTTQVQNFAYFLLGDTYFILIVILGPTLVFRYITVPLISFIRKIFVWGGN